MIEIELRSIANNFNGNIESVNGLLNFDRTVLDFGITAIERLEQRLRHHHKLDNPQLSAQQVLDTLRRIREHDSMRLSYGVIANQCIVLLVSHFATAIQDTTFRCSIDHVVRHELSERVEREELRLTIADLRQYDFNLDGHLGKLIVRRNDISFQDMKSIARAFKDYIGHEIMRDRHVNNIIYAQACRHAIVHHGARVDDILLRQVQNAHPRDLTMDFDQGSAIALAADAIVVVADSMKSYVTSLHDGVSSRFDTA